MPPYNLRSATIGDRIQHEFLIRDRSERTTRAGLPFVILTFGNATGTIESAPIWSERLDWAAGADRGRVVQVIGDVGAFGDEGTRKRQLQLTGPVRILPSEGFDASSFLERIDVPVEKLWDGLDRLRTEFRSEALRNVVDVFFADDAFRVAFERAPGSVNGHHAKLGGLLLHVWEVASIAKHMARTVRFANIDVVVAGALLHDIGKVEAYAVSPEGFSHTPVGVLLGHVALGAFMLDRRLHELEPRLAESQHQELLHLILSHHGALEFGSPVQPMTVEAELLHWADESSAKAGDMLDELMDPEMFVPGSPHTLSARRSWKLGRRLWRRSVPWE